MNENPYINTEVFNQRIASLPDAEKKRFFPERAHGLTETQTLVLPAIKWLFGFGPRAAGRTHVIAHTLIQLAIENERTPINLFDNGLALGVPHHIGVTRSMIPAIGQILKTDYTDFNLEINISNFTLTCTGRKS